MGRTDPGAGAIGVTGSLEERGHCEKLEFAKRSRGDEKEEKELG